MKSTTKIIVGLSVIVILISMIGYNVINRDESIKVGSILILSGSGASWGETAKNSIELAVQDINQNKILSKEIKVIYEDDQGDPSKTVTAFSKLTNSDDVDFIIGPTWSRSAVAIKPLINNVVVISPSVGSAEFNQGNEFIFNTRQHDYILSQNLAQYVFNKGFRQAAVLSAQDVYNIEQANAFKVEFEKLGGSVQITLEPQRNQADVRGELLKVKENQEIDVIILTTGGQEVTSTFGRQMKELQIDLPVFSLTLDQTVIDNCKGACDNWVFLSAFTPTPEFQEKYKTVYGKNVEIGGDSAYDAMVMLALAMKETGSTDPKIIAQHLSQIKEYEGVSGHLFADGEGGFTKNYVVKGIRNSGEQFILVE